MKRQFPAAGPLIMAQADRDREDSVLPAQRPKTLASTGDLCAVTAAVEQGRRPVRTGARPSHAIPAAVLCCCTTGPAVRISLLTCGVKGTRTPDPLLANRRQHVHRCLSPQLTVLGRASASARIRACCCTFPLYSPGRSAAGQRDVGALSQAQFYGTVPRGTTHCIA